MPLILGRSGTQCIAMVTKLLSSYCQTHLVEYCNVCSDLQIPERDKANELEVCRNKLVGGTTLQVVFKG